MKSLSIATVGFCSLVALAWGPIAEANGTKGMRADLPCPYGAAGGPNPDSWSATSGTSPFNPGLVTPNSATLVGGSLALEDGDQNSLAITSAIQYVYYSSPIPAASTCGADPSSVNPNGPLEQVLEYTMGDNTAVSQAGDIEVQFNYNVAVVPSLATTTGTASFTLGGVTYASAGTLLPANDNNDFLFSSTGALLGEIVLSNGSASLVSGVPQGWTIKSGGGGTMTAPEIDPRSSFAGLALLAGLIAVARGSRRTLKAAY
jgi:hypothetical protein